MQLFSEKYVYWSVWQFGKVAISAKVTCELCNSVYRGVCFSTQPWMTTKHPVIALSLEKGNVFESSDCHSIIRYLLSDVDVDVESW